MRAIIAALAALGGWVILAACAVSVATGDGSEAGWLVVGPLPFLVIGLVGFLRQPENRVAWWLVGVGVAFGCDVALGDVFLPMAENHWGVTSSITAAIALLDHWFAVAGPVAGVGLFGLFASGRPGRGWCASNCCGATRPRPTGWSACNAIWPPRCRTSGRSRTRSIRRYCPTRIQASAMESP